MPSTGPVEHNISLVRPADLLDTHDFAGMTFGIGYGHQRLADVADGENMQSFTDEPGGAARIPGRNKSRHLGTLADQGDGQVAGGGATGQNDDMGARPPFLRSDFHARRLCHGTFFGDRRRASGPIPSYF